MIFKLFGKSSEIFGSVRKYSEIFGKLRKRFKSNFQMFLWFLKSSENLWKSSEVFGNLRRYFHYWRKYPTRDPDVLLYRFYEWFIFQWNTVTHIIINIMKHLNNNWRDALSKRFKDELRCWHSRTWRSINCKRMQSYSGCRLQFF